MRPGIVMLVGRAAPGKSALAGALGRTLPDFRILDRATVETALFEPSDDSAAERSIAFSVVLDAARYHLGRGRTVAVDVGRQGEAEAVHGIAAEAGAFLATILCAPADFEPSDEYLTVDTAKPLADVIDVVLGYLEDMAQ